MMAVKRIDPKLGLDAQLQTLLCKRHGLRDESIIWRLVNDIVEERPVYPFPTSNGTTSNEMSQLFVDTLALIEVNLWRDVRAPKSSFRREYI